MRLEALFLLKYITQKKKLDRFGDRSAKILSYYDLFVMNKSLIEENIDLINRAAAIE